MSYLSKKGIACTSTAFFILLHFSQVIDFTVMNLSFFALLLISSLQASVISTTPARDMKLCARSTQRKSSVARWPPWAAVYAATSTQRHPHLLNAVPCTPNMVLLDKHHRLKCCMENNIATSVLRVKHKLILEGGSTTSWLRLSKKGGVATSTSVSSVAHESNVANDTALAHSVAATTVVHHYHGRT